MSIKALSKTRAKVLCFKVITSLPRRTRRRHEDHEVEYLKNLSLVLRPVLQNFYKNAKSYLLSQSIPSLGTLVFIRADCVRRLPSLANGTTIQNIQFVFPSCPSNLLRVARRALRGKNIGALWVNGAAGIVHFYSAPIHVLFVLKKEHIPHEVLHLKNTFPGFTLPSTTRAGLAREVKV